MSETGRYAFEGLDRLIHERARLGVMTCLMTTPEGLLFPELKSLCDLTDGNLSRHLKMLADAGLVELQKSGAGRHGQTRVMITSQGQQQFLDYLAELKSVVHDAESAAQELPSTDSLGTISSG